MNTISFNNIPGCPWRFYFSDIVDKPEPGFYRMGDAFTGETFLLNSPGIRTTIGEYHVNLRLNLIGFNGHWWQTFGPILG